MKAKGVEVYLSGNEPGFTLPPNIGELGDDITVLNLSYCSLTGSLSIRSERFIFATEIDVAFYAGPLPKMLPISLEVFHLGDNFRKTNKFTGGIPSEWGALTNLKELKIVACGLDGKPLRTRSERVICVLIIALFAVGCLPKELGDLANLTVLDVSGNWLTGQLNIRTERLCI